MVMRLRLQMDVEIRGKLTARAVLVPHDRDTEMELIG